MSNALTKNIDQSNTLPDARGKLVAASKLHWFHWLIVLCSLVLTFFAWYYSSSQKAARIELQFERESDRVLELVKERMGKYEDALWSGVALIRTTGDDVDFKTWQRYANSIHIEEKYPGINGIGVIHSVPASELETYLARQREQRRDFGIYPQHEGTENFPISYVIPVRGNEKAVGLDMAHEKNRYRAAKMARDSGESQITGPITLVQDTGKTPGFLFFAPFYKSKDKNEDNAVEGSIEQVTANTSVDERRSRFAGMVYAPFVVEKLMEGTLGKDKRQVGIRISDGDEMIYDEHQGHEEDFDPNPMFAESVVVKLFGRNWKFDIWTAKSFREATSDNQPLTILIGGLIMDGFLVFLFLSMTGTSQRSLRLADSMTVQLEKSTKILEKNADELQSSNERLRRFNDAAVGRELWMVVLKEEVNELLERSGNSHRYPMSTIDDTRIATPEDQPFASRSPHQELEKKGLRSKIAELESSQLAMLNMMEDAEHSRETLAEMNMALKQSNYDLEQFAYIASHDLQEPLRKVASFCSLLQEEYGERLDDEGRKYLDFAVDGAARMRQLVQDLLLYSKIGSQKRTSKQIDTHAALELAKLNLELLIEETNAKITSFDLPKVVAEQREIAQLFQNLIGNAIKYRSEEPPEIHISSMDSGNCWQFLVSDNGIGIAPEYQEQVFGIFKRLHSRNEYSGTGIGLAICKRIIDQLGGKIWVQQKAEPGCTICFTIPKKAEFDKGHPTIKMTPTERASHEHVATK